MTFENAVKRIAEKFKSVDGTKVCDMAIQVTLTDEDCKGVMYFKAASGVIDVQGYDYVDNDAAVEIDRKSFTDILSGKSTFEKAVNKGVATVKGDYDKLNTLLLGVPVPVKKPSVKKAVEKPEEKKPVAKKSTKSTAKVEKSPVKKASAKKATTKKA